MPEKLKTILQILCAVLAGIISTILAHTHSFAEDSPAEATPMPAQMLLPPSKDKKRARIY